MILLVSMRTYLALLVTESRDGVGYNFVQQPERAFARTQMSSTVNGHDGHW